MGTIDLGAATGAGYRPQRREDMLCEKLDGESVVFDPRCDGVHYLNTTALLIWNACDGSRTRDGIAAYVQEHLAIDSGPAVELVHGVIGQFSAKGLLTDDCPPPSIDSKAHAKYVNAEFAERTNVAEEVMSSLTMGGLTHPNGGGVSRRQVLGSGVAKMVYAAPVISTFFARGAYASNPIHPGSPLGTGDCKNVGYSCAQGPDCCDEDTGRTSCDNTFDRCCVRNNQSGCIIDDDCCDGRTCSGGTCIN